MTVNSLPSKAEPDDFKGRFREIISDPLNLLIARVANAGSVTNGFVRLHNGVEVPSSGQGSYYGEFSQILVYNRGVHEPLEEFVFQETLTLMPDAPLMLELGSYWAHYSMWLGKARPAARLVMVEPEITNLEAGRANFERNGLTGEFIQEMVGADRFEVDAFRKARCGENIDVLHADIQGAEVEMLDGARETLADQAVDRLFISTHSQALHKAVVERLDEHGYRIEVSSDFDTDTTSFDGLVVASSPLVRPALTDFVHLGRTEIARSSPERLIEYISAVPRCGGVQAGE